jgi:hypothetical protein
VTNYAEIATECDVTFSGNVVHPELGVVGHAYNDGTSGGTKFQPTDATRYSIDDLQEFADHCTERGRTVGSIAAIECVLDLMVMEAQTQALVTQAKRNDNSVMRLVATDVEHIGTEYEQLACWPRITFARSARLTAAQALAKGQPRLRPEQRWELFTGRGWVPLLEPQSDLPASETPERLAELQRIRGKWAETAAPHTPLQNQGPNRDGLYVSDWKARTGEFLLTSEPFRVTVCRCE